MEQIQDGTGSGKLAKVDSDNRLHVRSVTTTSEESASLKGLDFNLNTGIITLTNATKTPVFYLKNNEDYDLVIGTLFYTTGESTGGSGNILVEVIRNPTAGTIVSNATPIEMNANRNFGSSRSLSVSAYKGATGNTLTDGIKFVESISSTATQRVPVVGGAVIIPKGSSIAIQITPSTGNTSMAVEIGVSCYLKEVTND
jgi:hypothetical protein